MNASASVAVPAARVAEPTDGSVPVKALGNVLTIAAVVCAAVAAVILLGFDGWEYYRAPLGTRGYLPQHAWLRPSGPVGLSLGIAGVLSMLMTVPYAIRKRWKALSRLGTMKQWIEIHIFFGIVGPVLITFHTSFKFNGIVSVAYWLMMTVWLSGFVGRYLYVRIPKTIRGVELSVAHVEQMLAHARLQVESAALPTEAREELDAFHAAVTPTAGAPGALDLFFGELRVRARLSLLRRQLLSAGVDLHAVRNTVRLASDRAVLARRLAHLQRTHHLFELWHVFHRPLVYGLFVIVVLHVGIALLFGYASLP